MTDTHTHTGQIEKTPALRAVGLEKGEWSIFLFFPGKFFIALKLSLDNHKSFAIYKMQILRCLNKIGAWGQKLWTIAIWGSMLSQLLDLHIIV